MRKIGGKELDKFRHNVCVNDVQVLFIPKEKKDFNHHEFVWVRLKEQVNSTVLKGILLNDFTVPERYNNLKKGDNVAIVYWNDDLMGLPLHEQDNGLFSFRKNNI